MWRATRLADVKFRPNFICISQAQPWGSELMLIFHFRFRFTHRHRRTVSALHWRWGEGCKNSERSRACSHTSRSYSRRGPGTHSHLQRAPQTGDYRREAFVWGQLSVTGGGHRDKSMCVVSVHSNTVVRKLKWLGLLMKIRCVFSSVKFVCKSTYIKWYMTK